MRPNLEFLSLSFNFFKTAVTPWHFIWSRNPYWYTDITYKIIQN